MIAISDLLAHLNKLTAGDESAELQRILDAAVNTVEQRCGSLGTQAPAVLTVTSAGSRTLVLPARVGQVTQVLTPSGTAVDLATVTVYADAGLITVPVGYPGSWSVTVAANDTVPPDLRLAVLIIAAHLYETQRTTQPGRQGFGADGPPAGFSAGYGIPNRAAELMAAYRTRQVG